ncbi:hypothetical protein D3C71_1782870 [compost metagenome]
MGFGFLLSGIQGIALDFDLLNKYIIFINWKCIILILCLCSSFSRWLLLSLWIHRIRPRIDFQMHGRPIGGWFGWREPIRARGRVFPDHVRCFGDSGCSRPRPGSGKGRYP